MLVLTRKEGERIVIADEIQITVCHIGAGRVKIGVDAPPHVKIVRGEIRRIQQTRLDRFGELRST